MLTAVKNFTDSEAADNVSTNIRPSLSSENQGVHIHLSPSNDSIPFTPKHLRFMPAQEVKIGRVSGSRNQRESRSDNGVFNCEVMSREHALLKEDGGQIKLKDLKSTHGTYINGTRLGDGSVDSEWRELRHNDVITFGHNVRRNQNLYKHLSAHVHFPRNVANNSSLKNEPTSGGIKDTVNIGDLGETSKQKVNEFTPTKRNNTITESTNNIPKQSSINITTERKGKQDIVDVGESSTSSFVDKKASDKKTIHEKITVSNVLETREKIERVMAPSPAAEEHDEVQTGQQDITHTDINEASSSSSSSGGINDMVELESPDKPVTPAFTPDNHSVSSVSDMRTKSESTTNITTKHSPDIVAQKHTSSSQVAQDSDKIYLSLGESVDSDYKNINENPDINGEGPSILSQELKEPDSVTTTTLSINRKRKHDDISSELDNAELLKVRDQLKSRLEEKEEVGSAPDPKRGRFEVIVPTTVGMVIGAAGVLIGSYMFGV